MTIKGILRNLAAIVPIGFGFFVFLIFSILELIFEGLILDHFIIFSVLCLLPIALGIYALIRAQVINKEESDEELEVKVIKLAARSGGKVTVADVSMSQHINSTRAEAILQNLYSKNAVEVLVADNGTLVYALTNYSSMRQKETASSVL